MKVSWQQNFRKSFHDLIHIITYCLFQFYMQEMVLNHLIYSIFIYSIVLKKCLFLWLRLWFKFQTKNMRIVKVWESEAAVSWNRGACDHPVSQGFNTVTKHRQNKGGYISLMSFIFYCIEAQLTGLLSEMCLFLVYSVLVKT